MERYHEGAAIYLPVTSSENGHAVMKACPNVAVSSSKTLSQTFDPYVSMMKSLTDVLIRPIIAHSISYTGLERHLQPSEGFTD